MKTIITVITCHYYWINITLRLLQLFFLWLLPSLLSSLSSLLYSQNSTFCCNNYSNYSDYMAGNYYSDSHYNDNDSQYFYQISRDLGAWTFPFSGFKFNVHDLPHTNHTRLAGKKAVNPSQSSDSGSAVPRGPMDKTQFRFMKPAAKSRNQSEPVGPQSDISHKQSGDHTRIRPKPAISPITYA